MSEVKYHKMDSPPNHSAPVLAWNRKLGHWSKFMFDYDKGWMFEVRYHYYRLPDADLSEFSCWKNTEAEPPPEEWR